MAFNLGGNPTSLVPDSPAVKRQRTANGYTSTSNSANNTGTYNSDNDDGDALFEGFIPDTPGGTFHTQPTQIIDRSNTTPGPAQQPFSSPPETPVVQVPASSPFSGRDSEVAKPVQNAVPLPRKNLAMIMAPAGTAFRPPPGIVRKPLAPAYITIDDDEDDGPKFQGGSSDEDDALPSANIKPTTFAPRSAQSSFGASPTKDPSKFIGAAKFHSIVAGSAYKAPEKGKVFTNTVYDNRNRDAASSSMTSPAMPRSADSMSSGYGTVRKPQMQTRPERAQPIRDVGMEDISDENLRYKVNQLRAIYPNLTVMICRNTLLACKGSVEDAAAVLSSPAYEAMHVSVINLVDDGVESSQPIKRFEPQMKRTLDGPAQSIRDKYSSTQAHPKKAPGIATPPPKPKKRLVQGRKHPSSPATPAVSSPLKHQSSPAVSVHDYTDTDSGVASASEEDPELEGRVLKFLNTCKVEELVELTNITKDIAAIMIAARPFRNLDAARTVENPKPLKSGKKSNRAPVGDRIVDTAVEMFQGYEAIDTLVTKCGQLGKPLAEEMAKWGFDVFGTSKDGELEITSLEDDIESQRDSGIGSPSSATASNQGDEEVKVATRKRSNVQFLKKSDLMAEDCVLKDYQVVGLNWLALMYRHKLSCILADEMGLGKTCQVIAFISHLVEIGISGPHLVVVPGSTLENWLREFKRFSPNLWVEPYHGAQRERGEMAENILTQREEINVIVTTYDMAASKEDNKFMRRLRPDVCVYDEGHMLKNVNSKRYQGLIRIPATFRLLLTGTPLQNNLQELAALLAFILPDVFKELEEDLNFIFKAKATTSDADHAALLSAQRIARARSMLTPFVLRRKKAQVLKHLPPKVNRVEYTTLYDAQKEIYDGHLDQARERARVRVEGGKIPKSDENNPLMQLRKAAIHPLLFRRHFTNAKIEKMADILRKKEPVYFPSTDKREHLIKEMRGGSDFWLHTWCMLYPCIASYDIPDLAWMDSGKVDSMVKLVKTYKENGDRVLIFSQFTLVLDILESVLNSSFIHFTRIDGSTKIDERQSLIDTFRDDETITAFLLTTKAGGTGINLMYANKVIIFDGSFNPQDDRQAENRAHRVGQTRDVEVVRLVTKGTVEEQIFALGQSKLLLDGRVAGDSEDDKQMLEAGEKAVAKMLLEGTGMSSDADPAVKDEKDGKDEKVKKEEQENNKKPEGKKLPQRKKSSILDSMLTQSQDVTKTAKEDKKLVKVDEDGEEMLV